MPRWCIRDEHFAAHTGRDLDPLSLITRHRGTDQAVLTTADSTADQLLSTLGTRGVSSRISHPRRRDPASSTMTRGASANSDMKATDNLADDIAILAPG